MVHSVDSYKLRTDDRQQRKLSDAIELRLINSVKKIIKTGVRLNTDDWNALYALSVVASDIHRFYDDVGFREDLLKILQVLLLSGATDVHHNSGYEETALNKFVMNGQIDFVRLMLENGEKPTSTDLFYSCRLKDKDIFDLLFEYNVIFDQVSKDSVLSVKPIHAVLKYSYNGGDRFLYTDQRFSFWYDCMDARTVAKLNNLLESTYKKRAAYKEKVKESVEKEILDYFLRKIYMLDFLLSKGELIEVDYIFDAIKYEEPVVLLMVVKLAGIDILQSTISKNFQGKEGVRLIDVIKDSKMSDLFFGMLEAVLEGEGNSGG